MTRLDARLAQARAELSAAGLPRREAEGLLCHVLGVGRAHLYAHPDDALTGNDLERFDTLLRRRLAGEPVAYLVGHREFWSLELEVTPDVLIPRPETEGLVEAVLQRLPDDRTVRIADLGTGSGAVALAIASERPLAEVHATDTSEAALAVARRNAERLGQDRVRFHRGSWCEPLEGRFAVIASNPPYVDADDPHLREGDCRFEPPGALTPGADGLAAIREIAAQAPAHLEPGGWLVLEHGWNQGDALREILAAAGFDAVETQRDLAGHERITLGRHP